MWGRRYKRDVQTGYHGRSLSNLVVSEEALGESLRINRRKKVKCVIPNHDKKLFWTITYEIVGSGKLN